MRRLETTYQCAYQPKLEMTPSNVAQRRRNAHFVRDHDTVGQLMILDDMPYYPVVEANGCCINCCSCNSCLQCNSGVNLCNPCDPNMCCPNNLYPPPPCMW